MRIRIRSIMPFAIFSSVRFAFVMLGFTAISFTMLGSVNAFADLDNANEIVNRANLAAFYSGNDGRAETRMTIVDAQQRKQRRQFTILRRNIEKGGDQDILVFLNKPADIKRTVFLVKKHPGGDDDRWLYLPGLDLVKRIAAGDKRTSFIGSHFFYEDVSGRGIYEDTHTLIETTDTQYVIQNVPKDPKKVEFSEYTVWVDKINYLPVRAEYKDANGKLYRRVEAIKIETVDGFATATKMKVSDLRDGGYTLNEMRFIKYNLGLPKTIYSERSLRNPPKKWLQRPGKK